MFDFRPRLILLETTRPDPDHKHEHELLFPHFVVGVCWIYIGTIGGSLKFDFKIFGEERSLKSDFNYFGEERWCQAQISKSGLGL